MADYYLAPDGSDSNAGSSSAPFASLQTLLSALEAGDTGYVRGGTYDESGFADGSDQHGTASAPIRLEAVDGADVVFDFGSGDTGGLRLWKCSHWEVRGFTVRNAPSYGVYVFGDSTDVTVENVTVEYSGGDPGTSGAGFHVRVSANTVLRDCVSRYNYDPSSGGGNADGFAVSQATDTVVEDCVAYGNSDDGFDLWESTGQRLSGCVAHSNGWDLDGNPAGDGNGFKLGGGSLPSGGHLVTRCVAYQNRRRGIHYNTAEVAMEVYNCTAWDNPTNFYFTAGEHVLRNNISSQGTVNIQDPVDDAWNSWTLDVGDPDFASTDPSSSKFLHLTTGSAAVDAGTDVGLDFDGDAPDLGAFETDGGQDVTSNVNPVLKAATPTDGGDLAFTAGTLHYYDGSRWVAPPVSYYDGSQYLTVSEGVQTDAGLVDGFERGDLTPYAGDLGSFNVSTDRAAEGSNALKTAGGRSAWEDIRSTEKAIPHGSTFQARVYFTDAADSAILRFGVADQDNWLGAGYNSNESGIQLSESVDGSWTELGTAQMTPVTGEWMTFRVEWGVDDPDQIRIRCFDADGVELGTGTTTTSANQGNTGYGFEYTFQYGGTGPVYFDDLRIV